MCAAIAIDLTSRALAVPSSGAVLQLHKPVHGDPSTVRMPIAVYFADAPSARRAAATLGRAAHDPARSDAVQKVAAALAPTVRNQAMLVDGTKVSALPPATLQQLAAEIAPAAPTR
jgi:hypothetical protein